MVITTMAAIAGMTETTVMAHTAVMVTTTRMGTFVGTAAREMAITMKMAASILIVEDTNG